MMAKFRRGRHQLDAGAAGAAATSPPLAMARPGYEKGSDAASNDDTRVAALTSSHKREGYRWLTG